MSLASSTLSPETKQAQLADRARSRFLLSQDRPRRHSLGCADARARLRQRGSLPHLLWRLLVLRRRLREVLKQRPGITIAFEEHLRSVCWRPHLNKTRSTDASPLPLCSRYLPSLLDLDVYQAWSPLVSASFPNLPSPRSDPPLSFPAPPPSSPASPSSSASVLSSSSSTASDSEPVPRSRRPFCARRRRRTQRG